MFWLTKQIKNQYEENYENEKGHSESLILIFKPLLSILYSIIIIQIMKALTIIVLSSNITDNPDLL